MPLYHVNFHTLDSKPIFENDAYDQLIRAHLFGTIRQRKIICLAWEVMPTHVHMLIEDFPDFSRGAIVHYLKGASARAFFDAFPELRGDLLGGHLWTKGYHFVHVKTHRQLVATLQYIRANRAHADLPPPAPLIAAGRE